MEGVLSSINWPEKIIFCEVGPRDGLQNEPVMLSVEQKLKMIEGAADAGVPIIEVGSFVHPKAVRRWLIPMKWQNA